MIYIGNLHKGQEATLRHGVVVRCDRGHSVLCNPFRITSEDKRNESCDRFQAYFDRKVREKKDADFMNELRRIYQLALRQDVTLACWCYPKRCHTRTIKAFLEQYLRKDPRYTQSKTMPAKTMQDGLSQIEQQRLQWFEKKGCDARKQQRSGSYTRRYSGNSGYSNSGNGGYRRGGYSQGGYSRGGYNSSNYNGGNYRSGTYRKGNNPAPAAQSANTPF